MCRGGRISAAILVAAAFTVGCVGVAAVPAGATDDEEKRVLLFPGRDLWRNGAFAYGGLLLAPGAIDQDGFNLRLNPNSSKVYNNRANAHYRKGEYARAVPDYDRALKIDPDFTTARQNRVEAIKMLNQ